MNPILQMARAFASELIGAAGPTVVSAGAGAILGGALALGLALLGLRLSDLLHRRPVRVASLAARGASRAEIARRTGISQDAVGMLLHVRNSHRGRRNLPAPARIAALHRFDGGRRDRDENPQVIGAKVDTEIAPGWSRSARPLPSAVAKANRSTRSGRAA